MPTLTMKDESVIPEGLYCYTYENGKQVNCPYWKYVSEQNAYCEFLDISDKDISGISLLWDQCKECGINDEYFPDDEDPYSQIEEITKTIKKLETEQQEAETWFDFEKSTKMQNKLDIIYDEIDNVCKIFDIDHKDEEECE